MGHPMPYGLKPRLGLTMFPYSHPLLNLCGRERVTPIPKQLTDENLD